MGTISPMAISRLRAVLAGAAVVVAGCTGTTPASPTAAAATPVAGTPAAGTAAAPPTPVSTPAALWPAPPNPMELTLAAGLQPETIEHLAFHVHAHLDIFLDGQPVLVPSGIGINIQDPAVGTFPHEDGSVEYGGIEQPCATPCISPLHTHWSVGTIHTESATPVPNTLGQLFVEWGVELSQACVGEHCSPAKEVAFYVNGQPYTGDPKAIELADMTEVAIVIGTPPAQIPSTADFAAP